MVLQWPNTQLPLTLYSPAAKGLNVDLRYIENVLCDICVITNPLGGALPPLGKSVYSKWRPRWLLSYTERRFFRRSLKKCAKYCTKDALFN